MTTQHPAPKYTRLKIQGPLSVAPITPKEVKGQRVYAYVLMGPTGSGKSTFIESLSPDQQLKISKDSLESVTQQVTCYKVVNLTHKATDMTFILVDTPGFLDTKLSESRITRMITEKLNKLRGSSDGVIACILYFQPITDIRIGGSKRGAIKLLRAFAESFQADEISVITTMWNNTITAKHVEDASRRFDALKDEIFKRSDVLNMSISKFEFTKESALSLLDGRYSGWVHDIQETKNPQYQSLIRDNLLERIANIQQRLCLLIEDKQSATTLGSEDLPLLDVIENDEAVALAALQSFLDDLYDIDPKSCSSPLPRLSLRVVLNYRFSRLTAPVKRVFKQKK